MVDDIELFSKDVFSPDQTGLQEYLSSFKKYWDRVLARQDNNESEATNQ